MFPSTRLQIIRSIITVRATERQTRGFVPANGRRYRTIICSTLSIFNRGPQIYLRRLPRSLHFTIVRNDAIVSYSFFSPFFFLFFIFLFFSFLFYFWNYIFLAMENRAKRIPTQMDKDERTGYQMTRGQKMHVM